MPITPKRRANPPDQPENNTHHSAETTENASATNETVQSDSTPGVTEQASQPAVASPVDRVENNPQSSPTEAPVQPSSPPVTHAATNGERPERQAPERHNGERQETFIESCRRTPRG